MNTLKKGAVQRLTYNRVAVATLVLIVVGTAGYTGAGGEQEDAPKPLVIKDQGGHSFGGTILGDFETASVHCDHGYVEYQIPVNPRQLSMLMVHSASTQTWEKTFAGDEGYKNIFLRRDFSVYITDAPRVGRGGWGCRSGPTRPTSAGIRAR